MRLLRGDAFETADSEHLLGTIDLDELMVRVLSKLSNTIEAELFEIYVFDSELDRYVLRGSSEGFAVILESVPLRGISEPFENALSGRTPGCSFRKADGVARYCASISSHRYSVGPSCTNVDQHDNRGVSL